MLAFIITLICAIICGIVLYKPVISNYYFIDLADEYVFNVFNFRNTQLLFTHLLSDLIYFYICFFIAYFTKLKYITLIFIYLRGLFLGIYSVILVAVDTVGGVFVMVFVFLPATLFSLAICYAVTEFCKRINKKYAVFVPAVLAIADLVVYALLINVVFRVVIVIV